MQKILSFGKGSGVLPYQIGDVAQLALLGFELAPTRNASKAVVEFCQQFNALPDGAKEVDEMLETAISSKFDASVYTRAVCIDTDTNQQVRTINVGFSEKPQHYICVEGNEYENAQGNKVKGRTLRKATTKEIEAYQKSLVPTA